MGTETIQGKIHHATIGHSDLPVQEGDALCEVGRGGQGVSQRCRSETCGSPCMTKKADPIWRCSFGGEKLAVPQVNATERAYRLDCNPTLRLRFVSIKHTAHHVRFHATRPAISGNSGVKTNAKSFGISMENLA